VTFKFFYNTKYITIFILYIENKSINQSLKCILEYINHKDELTKEKIVRGENKVYNKQSKLKNDENKVYITEYRM